MQWRDTGHGFDLGHQQATQQIYQKCLSYKTRLLLAGEGEGHSQPERLIGQKYD